MSKNTHVDNSGPIINGGEPLKVKVEGGYGNMLRWSVLRVWHFSSINLVSWFLGSSLSTRGLGNTERFGGTLRGVLDLGEIGNCVVLRFEGEKWISDREIVVLASQGGTRGSWKCRKKGGGVLGSACPS